MDELLLREMIQRLRTLGQEWDTVDAKRQLVIREPSQKAELVKDVTAMANNVLPSYIIIGLKDKTFESVGVLHKSYTQNDINQVLAGKIDPPVVVNYQEFALDEEEFAVLEIIGRNPPYIIAEDMSYGTEDNGKVRIPKGTIYVRHQDRTEGISRAELDQLLERRMFAREFAGESKEAQLIARERPDYWEYKLTVELLRSRITVLRREIRDLDRGVRYGKAQIMSGREFLKWTREKLVDLQSLIRAINAIVNEDFALAWGKPGEPGDALEIKRTVDRLSVLFHDLVDWETNFRSVVPPEAFTKLRSLMEGWAVHVFSSLENLPDKLEAVYQQSSVEGTHEIELVIPSVDAEAVSLEANRLTANLAEWLDDY